MAGKKEWGKGSPSVKLHSVQVFGDMQVAGAKVCESGLPSVKLQTVQVLGDRQVAGAKVCKSGLPRTSPQEQTAGDEHVASEK